MFCAHFCRILHNLGRIASSSDECCYQVDTAHNCRLLLDTVMRLDWAEGGQEQEKLVLGLEKEKGQEKELVLGLVPRHAHILLLLPFFPLVLIFVGGSGVSFVITGILEMLLR